MAWKAHAAQSLDSLEDVDTLAGQEPEDSKHRTAEALTEALTICNVGIKHGCSGIRGHGTKVKEDKSSTTRRMQVLF